MTHSANRAFQQLNELNGSIDNSIESIVNVACMRDETELREDRKQLEKTTRLLFLSSLIFGEREIEEADLED